MLISELEIVERIKESIVREVKSEIERYFKTYLESVRWVKAAEYGAYYGVSNITLWRIDKELRKAKALRGTGKMRRFDKLHNPAEHMPSRSKIGLGL
jgi:hypothetical protein